MLWAKCLGEVSLPGDFGFFVSELQAALNETRYCGVEVEELVERYFKEKIVSNSQKREEKRCSITDFGRWCWMRQKVGLERTPGEHVG